MNDTARQVRFTKLAVGFIALVWVVGFLAWILGDSAVPEDRINRSGSPWIWAVGLVILCAEGWRRWPLPWLRAGIVVLAIVFVIGIALGLADQPPPPMSVNP